MAQRSIVGEPGARPRGLVAGGGISGLSAAWEERHPGLLLAGGSLGAVGLPDCIAAGRAAGHAAVDHLTQRSERVKLAI